MRPLSAAILLLTAASSSLVSQAPLSVLPSNQNCPVALVAQPRFDQGILPAAPHRPRRAGVSLSLEDLTGRHLLGADVLLRGTPVRHGVQPASSTAGSAASPTRTVHIQTAGETPGTLAADLWLSEAATITTVTLTAISYADAPAWHAGPDATCTTTPNGHLLIGRLR